MLSDASDEGIARIADFGFATRMASEEPIQTISLGTLGYMAPEVCQQQPYGFSSDIWSFGVLLFNLISQEKDPFIPHEDATMEEIFVCTCDKQIRFQGEEWEDASDEVKDLIQSMLQKEPQKRPNIEDVCNHKWF